jgi:hypothetical protein
VMPSISFLRKCNFKNNQIYVDDLYMSAIVRVFFRKVSVIFNTVLPTLSKTLYINVVKFPASTSVHNTVVQKDR